MYYNFKPMDFKESNNRLEGFELPDSKRHLAKTKDVEALPAYFDGQQRITIWKCDSWRAKFRFLFKGEINLIEMTENPNTCPKAVSIGPAFSS